MNNFAFHSPIEFVFGRDTEKQTGILARKYGARKVMIVYGGSSAVKSGLLARVEESLVAEGIDCVKLGGVRPNPTDVKVYEGIELARKEQIDFIIAVGGGSVIDTAKAIGVGKNYEGDFWDFYDGTKQVDKVHTSATAVPVAVVLTIPAAGSEASGNSVITKEEGQRKLSFRTDYIMKPKFSIMNPELTYTLPSYQTACGVADMMVHVMERYFSNTEGVDLTDRMAEAVMKSVVIEAPKVMANPNDYDSRANIMWAGTQAHNGLCGVGREEEWASHFIEHEVSAVYDVAHGAGLAAIVPAWMTFAAERNPGKIAQFAERVMDVRESDVLPSAGTCDTTTLIALEGIRRLKDFWKSIGLPVSLKELGIENPDIDLLVRKLRQDKGDRIGFYVKIEVEDMRTIFELAR